MLDERSHEISKYSYLINPILKRFNYYSSEYDDLYQIGLIAINKALSNYKEIYNNKQPFIAKWILMEYKNYFKNKTVFNLVEELDVMDTNEIDYYFLKDELKKLGITTRKVLILKYFNNTTQNDIAKILKISQATVSRIEQDGLNILRKAYM